MKLSICPEYVLWLVLTRDSNYGLCSFLFYGSEIDTYDDAKIVPFELMDLIIFAPRSEQGINVIIHSLDFTKLWNLFILQPESIIKKRL